VLLSIAKWKDFAIGNSEHLCLTVVLLSIAKWKDFAMAIQSGIKNTKNAGCNFFVFLLSAVRRHEGGGKRPPELPLRNPSTVPIEKRPPANVRLNCHCEILPRCLLKKDHR